MHSLIPSVVTLQVPLISRIDKQLVSYHIFFFNYDVPRLVEL